MEDNTAVFKDLPYYKAIWKECLKKQIGNLLQELSAETGEESVIIMANITTGTSSCFGSDRAKGFIEASDDVKTRFLSHCLKSCHLDMLPVRSVIKPGKRKFKEDLKNKKIKQAKLSSSETDMKDNTQLISSDSQDMVAKDNSHSVPDQSGFTQEDSPNNSKTGEKSDLCYQGPLVSTFSNKGQGHIVQENDSNLDSLRSDSMICIKTEQPDYEYSPSQDSDASNSNIFPGENSDLSFNETQGSISFSESPGENGGQFSGATPQPIGPIRFLRKFPPRARTLLSLPEKIQIIHEYESGTFSSQRQLADKYNISKTAVGEMLRNKDILKAHFEINANTKRKRFCTSSKFADINEIVWNWFTSARKNGVQMSGPMIQEKALQVAQELNVPDFKGSNGWLHSWKSRYNVSTFRDGSIAASKENCIIDYSKIEGYIPSEDEIERTSAIMNFGSAGAVGNLSGAANLSSPRSSDLLVAGSGSAGSESVVNFQDTIHRLLNSEPVHNDNEMDTSVNNSGVDKNNCIVKEDPDLE